MIEKIKENLMLYAPIYLICTLLGGWIVVAFQKNYFLTTLYPLYIAVVITGLGVVKYQEKEINQAPRYALELELKVFPKVIILSLCVMLILFVFKIIAWEILLIPFLLIIVTGIRLSFVSQFLQNSKEHNKKA